MPIRKKNFGLTIDNELNFDVHITNLRKVASAKLKDQGRIPNRLNILLSKGLIIRLSCFSFTLL